MKTDNKQKNNFAVIHKAINFVKTDIWRIRLQNISGVKSFLIKQLRIIILARRGFDEDKCQLRASALTFYSLLSIVPIFAAVFGFARGFGFDNLLKTQLLRKFPGQEEVFMRIIAFSHTLLENTKRSMVAGAGVAILFWSLIKVLGTIEQSFNDIWGIKEARTLGRKFADYFSLIIICPLLVILSSSITVFIATQITLITQKIAFLGNFKIVIFPIMKLLPYCVIWVLFTFMYIFMPNTKVNFRSGFLGGITAGTIYQIVQWIYIIFQVGVAKYNAIYGSFAALPLFLVWLQMSWLIVLLGAEISFADQNVDLYEFERDSLQISFSLKKILSLKTIHLLINNFSKGKKPFTDTQISHTLEIPIRLVRQILYELVESGLVSEVRTSKDKEPAFQPARDISLFTMKYVIDALEKRGANSISGARTEEFDKLTTCLQGFDELIEKSPHNRVLKDL
ncbi:MAG: YhjD/YihY/BrkB family envelope integrity protein [bacterium]